MIDSHPQRQWSIRGRAKPRRHTPAKVDGEDYSSLLPIRTGFTQLTVTKKDGVRVTYTQ